MEQGARAEQKAVYNMHRAVSAARADIAGYVTSRMRSDDPGSWAEDLVFIQSGGPVMAAREGHAAEVNGVQRLEISYAALMRGEPDVRWVTYDEAIELGWQVKRNNHASVVEDTKRTAGGYDIYNQNLYNAQRCAHSGEIQDFAQVAEDADVEKVIDDLLKSMRCHVYMGADRVAYFEMPVHNESFAVMPDIDEYPSRVAALSDIIRIAGEESYNYKMSRDKKSNREVGRKNIVDYGLACELSAAFIAQSLRAPLVAGAASQRDYPAMAAEIEGTASRSALFRAATDAEKAAQFELTNVRRHVTQKETAHLDTVRGRGHGREHVWEFKRYVPRHVVEALDDAGVGRDGMSTPDMDGSLDIERAKDAFIAGWPMINDVTGDVYMATGRTSAKAYPGGLESAGKLLASTQEKGVYDAIRAAIAGGEDINYGEAHSILSRDGGWEVADEESICRYMDNEQAFLQKMAENEREAPAPVREAEAPSRGAGAAAGPQEAAEPPAPREVADAAGTEESKRRAEQIIAAVGESMRAPAAGARAAERAPEKETPATKPVQTQLPWSVLQPWQTAYRDDGDGAPAPENAQTEPAKGGPAREPGTAEVHEQASEQVPEAVQAPATQVPEPATVQVEPAAAPVNAPETAREPSADAQETNHTVPVTPAPREAAETAPAAGAPASAEETKAPTPTAEAPVEAEPREPAWNGILSAPNTAKVASVTAWYQGHEKQLFFIGGTRPGPACWGAQFSIGQGRATVTSRELVSCFHDRAADPQRFLLLARTRELGGGTLPLDRAMEVLSGGSEVGGSQEAIARLVRENASADVQATTITPESYTPDQLAMLCATRPDLFGDKDCEKYPELAEIRDAHEEREAEAPKFGMQDLPWMAPAATRECKAGQDR